MKVVTDMGPEVSIESECEQLFETLSANAWDGLVDAIKGRREGVVQQVAEEKDEDVVF